MAAQVEVQTGEVGRAVAGARLHLNPLTDASNKSLIEIPSINQAHIISPEPNKPAPSPKPRLTPKPFTVEKNPTIKPILAPKPQTKPRPESTRLAGYKPDPPSAPKPTARPVSTNPNRPASTSFKTSNKLSTGQTAKPIVQPFKPAPPLPGDLSKPTLPVFAERQKPAASSLAYSKSFKGLSAAEWSGTTTKDDERGQKVQNKGGASITRAKSMGFLVQVGQEEEVKDKTQPEVSVPLRPQPRSSRPRPVSAIFPISPTKAEAPVPAPRWAGRRPLSADLTSKFESIGLSLHHKSPKENTKENTPEEKVLPQRKEQEKPPTSSTPQRTEGAADLAITDQSDKKTEETALKETEEEKHGTSIKSRISLLLDSSSPGAGLTGPVLDLHSPVQPVPETEPQVGVKQLIKQLTEDVTPTQSPVIKPVLKPRPLPLDLTKRFSSERSPDLVSLTEAADRHDISKDPQTGVEESVVSPNDQKIFLDFKDSFDLLKKPSTPNTSEASVKESGSGGEAQTVRASLFENVVERHSVFMLDEGRSTNTTKYPLSSLLFDTGAVEDEGSPITAIYTETLSPSSPLRVLHAFDTVHAVEGTKTVSESVPLAQWEDKAMTLRSRRSEGTRSMAEKTDEVPAQLVTLTPEPQLRYLRIGAIQKWATTGLDQDAGLEKGMFKEPQSEVQVTIDKDRSIQRIAEQDEAAKSPKRLKMLQAEEQPKPRATYFALTGQLQEPVSPGDVAPNFGNMTVPSDNFSVRSALGSSQGKILTVKRNPSLDEAFGKNSLSQEQFEKFVIKSHMSSMEIRSQMTEQTKEETIETEKKKEQNKETERQRTKIKELERETLMEIEKQAHLEFTQMKEREMQREAERKRQKLFEKEKQEFEEKQRALESHKQIELEKLQEFEKKQREKRYMLERQKLQELEIEKKRREIEREQQLQFEKDKQELERVREKEKLEREREKERQRQRDEERQRQLDKERLQLEIQKEKQKMEEMERIKELERQRLLEYQKQKQKEREKQQLIELERQRLREKTEREEAEKLRQMALEQEMLRIKELEKERAKQRELERQIEKEKQMELEKQRQRELEKEKQRQLDIQRQELENQRARQQELEKEKQRKEELERLKEMEKRQLLEFERQRQAERELEKRRLKEKMEREEVEKREEAEKMRLVAKQQEAERQRLKEKQRKEEQERLRLESLALKPKVLDLDSVLRNDLSPKSISQRSDPATRWKEPYKPAILDIDSFTSQAQLSPSIDFFPASSFPGLDTDCGIRLQATPERELNWKVPPQSSGGFSSPVWTTSPQDPWELRPVEMSVDKPMAEPRKPANKLSSDQLSVKQQEWPPNPQRHWPAFLDEPSFLASIPVAEGRTGTSPHGLSSSTPGEQIWIPREPQPPKESRIEIQSQRRSQGSQELNRMRSRSVSRRSAPSSSAVEGNLSRMRSRSAHREQGRHSWQKQSGDEDEKDSETAVHETDSQYGTWETGLRTDDSLTPATPSSESNLTPSPRKPTSPHTLSDHTSQLENDSPDGLLPSSSSESQSLHFPDAPTTLLDTSALRSRAQLLKKRAPRMRPSKAARQKAEVEEGNADDWLFRDSTEAKPEKDDDSESEERARGADAGPAVASQSQRVALFPGVDPSALKAQLKKRGDPDNQTDLTAPIPSPSQLSRSPKSPFLPRAARVLPPPGGKDNSEEGSPQWLKELKSKKRLSQYENDN
ncbi:protein piccolo isoform X2 [Melanotaenia boesemani]|uniref:protein piccolo isoform X2 n=1 Tax=Melanotaenia boesemani TaxID=1250792 RepID=UPI001C057638|nr:protein piccolo isoform X2 [Melanotaenia boesemani]